MLHKKSIDYGIPFKKSNEIRQLFINYFKDRDHTFIPSASIAPSDDPSIFFTNAGMNQFKSLFLGASTSDLKRAVNTQKCLRVSGKHNDLEEVGFDGTHHTFFEMLGNWSFGDYYKKEIIRWSWDLLTEVYKIPKNRLFVTVYKDDEEAENLWKSETDIEHQRILRFDKDNFWEMGAVGPCGPCSEIHFDNGDLSTQKSLYRDKIQGVNGQNERFIEIWNLVFMQYERLPDGSLKDLKHKHVDTGAGFERLCAVVQNKDSNYETDVFSPLIEAISDMTESPYNKDHRGVAHRVMSDHLRALVFAICDGITPGNEGRGYVIRRILRRASRFAYGLGQEEPCLFKLVDPLIDSMAVVFPELKKRRDYIKQVIQAEESRFLRTLGQGLSRFDKLTKKLQKSSHSEISGEDVFLFHDTYGFPSDLTRLMAKEQGFTIDEIGYHECMDEQKTRARKASKFSSNLISDDNWNILEEKRETKFLGYKNDSSQSKTLRYCEVSDEIYVVLDKTPFYAEAGGQVGDRGTLSNDELKLQVLDTFKILDLHVHKCQLVSGLINDVNFSSLEASINKKARYNTVRNHSATHLLHSSLKEILGDHVNQQGSYVGPERLRFDYTHYKSLSEEEILQIESKVNEKIRENLQVETDIMSLDKAKSSGAMALFGEKYDSTVRVLTMGAFSKELCGGTHVERTGDIGGFSIISEVSIASGVRRIEALTGEGLNDYITDQRKIINGLSKVLKVPTSKIKSRMEELVLLVKEQNKMVDRLKEEKVSNYLKSIVDQPSFHVEKEPVYLADIDSNIVGKKDLQLVLDKVQNRIENGLVVMTFKEDLTCNLLVAVGVKSLKNLHAGKIIKDLASHFDGKGGGRPDKAQAGIKVKPLEEDLKKKLFEVIESHSKK